jgi:hypothetical protein
MAEYGQAIPPRWFQDQTPRQVSKMNFAHLIHRALLQVGMQAINTWCFIPDFESAANAEYPITTNRNDLLWFYDFPTTDTWVVEGVSYRAVLGMHVGSIAGQSASSLSSNDVGSYINFKLFYRRADRLARNDLMCRSRAHQNSYLNYGFGNHNDPFSPSSAFVPGDESHGCFYYDKDWVMYRGSSDATRTTFLGLNNLHVILGKGGLTVQVGRGTSGAALNDVLSFSAVFGGARIPGRARIPASDPNLTRMCPVIWMPHEAVYGSSYHRSSDAVEGVSLGGRCLGAYLLGGQHDLKIARAIGSSFPTRPGTVYAPIYNLENIERPLYPILQTATRSSPRTLAGVGGAHILQPMVYATRHVGHSANDYIGPIDNSIRVEPTPSWFDVWYVPKFRFGDASAPLGEYVDPVTNLNWFIFSSQSVGCRFATEVEGITKFTTFTVAFGTEAVFATDYYNLNGGFTWVDPSPHAASMVPTGGTLWTTTPATDEATLVDPASSDSSRVLTFTSSTYSADISATTTKFTLQCDLMYKSVSAGGGSNTLSLQYSIDGSTWVNLLTIANVGVTAGPYQNYTATPEYTIVMSPTGGELRFRLIQSFATTAGGIRTAGIRNIRIRQYRRV